MRKATFALTALACLIVAAPASAARTHTFDGTCEISGPIFPEKPINVIPVLGARFAFHARGNCTGRLDDRPNATRRARFDVNRGEVLFDTCELGPDISIKSTLSIRIRRKKYAQFPLGLDMLRVLTFGPFLLQGPGGGQGLGLAQLVAADPAQDLAACLNPSGGITTTSLEATFQTLEPFVGSS